MTFTHTYNKANLRDSQKVTDNSWLNCPAATPGTVSYTANALNQYSAVGAAGTENGLLGGRAEVSGARQNDANGRVEMWRGGVR